jgi:hypothetical protein
MAPNDEPASFAAKPAVAEGRKGKPTGAAEDQPAAELVSITLDAATGVIVKLERVDPSGARHELSDEDRTRLTVARATLERLVEQAFEAGIDCVLGQGESESAPAETDEDAELSGLLLRSLMEGSGAARLTQGDVLGPAIVGTLFSHTAMLRTPSADSAATH